MTLRTMLGIYDNDGQHWVGDGFPVTSVFSYRNRELLAALSPFLLLDHAGPAEFAPTTARRGVGQHPHQGFETVTVVFEGELEHRDSAGHGGTIAAGDVQWMTAASGVLHEEYHSAAFARSGGRLHMAQLWVNLPARDKKAPPGYQTLLRDTIPQVALDGGELRVIAGEYQGRRGPARTFTPIDLWQIRLRAGATLRLTPPARHNAALVALQGSVRLNASALLASNRFALFARADGEIALTAESDALLLFLGGAPIEEPIAAYGPFVMNTQEEIRAAVDDWRTRIAAG